jgi:hypothetical protein
MYPVRTGGRDPPPRGAVAGRVCEPPISGHPSDVICSPVERQIQCVPAGSDPDGRLVGVFVFYPYTFIGGNTIYFPEVSQ